MMRRNELRYRFVSASGSVLATIRYDGQEGMFIAKVEICGVEMYARAEIFEEARKQMLDFIDDIADSLTDIGVELMDAEEEENA